MSAPKWREIAITLKISRLGYQSVSDTSGLAKVVRKIERPRFKTFPEMTPTFRELEAYPAFCALGKAVKTQIPACCRGNYQECRREIPQGSCTCETRGLLQRSSVVAASRRYVGKETDRRWEQGEDLSLVEFKTVEYEGSKKVLASDEITKQILKTGIRKLERETGVSHQTINKILSSNAVRRKTLSKIAQQFQRAERL